MLLTLSLAVVYSTLINVIIINYKKQKLKYEHRKLIKNFERCVSCGVVVHINKSTAIDNRLYYIEGSGQLCVDCHQEMYPK
jgi:hypothetical protein